MVTTDPTGGKYRRFTAADVRINTPQYDWSTFKAGPPGPACDGAFDFESVATHEFGHNFGLQHPTPLDAHPALTMSAYVGPCGIALRTLGRGDVLGMRAMY